VSKETVQPPLNYSGSFAGKAVRNSIIVILVTMLSVYIGSEFFTHVDLALFGYLTATIVCFVTMTMRITAWTLRPPTRRLWQQGFQMIKSRKGIRFFFSTLFRNIGAQEFVHSRSAFRWIMHLLISWGVIFSFGITFALVLNWMHFELVEPKVYQVVIFGIPLFRMGVDSFLAILLYHGLNWTGIAVIIGCAMAMYRRAHDRKRLVEQMQEYDIFPLVLLIAISVTGSLLTVSALWMEGTYYLGIAIAHEITVIIFLLYLPYSKFWHLPLRFLAVVVPMYHALNEQKPCARCGREYATKAQIHDVQLALRRRNLSAPIQNTELHMSDLCSECRRTSLRLGAYGATIGLGQANVFAKGNGGNGLMGMQEGADANYAQPEH
jgi:hypothetical protein